MAEAYDRAYDPSRVPQIEARMKHNSSTFGRSAGPDGLRGANVLHGFVGPAKNGVRTRPKEPPAGHRNWRWEQSPADYNEMSTALTNRAKSGEAAKDTASFTEMVDRHNQADTTRTFGKKTTIKINTDPTKGK
jgi:hypothetical protein